MKKQVRREGQKFGSSQTKTHRKNSTYETATLTIERKIKTMPVRFPNSHQEHRTYIKQLVDDNVPAHLLKSVGAQIHQIHRTICPPELSKNEAIKHFQKAALFGLNDPTSKWKSMLVKALTTGIANELIGFLKAFAVQLMKNDPYASEPSVVEWWNSVLETCQAVAANF